MADQILGYDLKRVVSMVGAIDHDTIRAYLDNIRHLMLSGGPRSRTKPIFLEITMSGGNADLAFSFYDRMNLWQVELVTVACGDASSAALIILAAGRERLVTPHTRMLIHDVRLGVDDGVNRQQHRNVGVALHTCADIYIDILVKRSGGRLTVRRLSQLMKRERYIGAEEAVDLGLADAVISH